MLAADPGWLEGHAYRVQLVCTAGEVKRITESFDRALRLRPRDVFLWRELIISLIRALRYRDALETIARARAAAGPHPTFDANEAICVDEIGDHGHAQQPARRRPEREAPGR